MSRMKNVLIWDEESQLMVEQYIPYTAEEEAEADAEAEADMNREPDAVDQLRADVDYLMMLTEEE